MSERDKDRLCFHPHIPSIHLTGRFSPSLHPSALSSLLSPASLLSFLHLQRTPPSNLSYSYTSSSLHSSIPSSFLSFHHSIILFLHSSLHISACLHRSTLNQRLHHSSISSYFLFFICFSIITSLHPSSSINPSHPFFPPYSNYSSSSQRSSITLTPVLSSS